MSQQSFISNNNLPWRFELECTKGLMLQVNKNYLNQSLGMGLLITIISSVLLYAKLRNGVLFSSDSYTYLFAAKGLLQQGELFNLYGETNLTVFPPLYPLILAAIQRFGLSGDSAAVIINICAMSVCTFSSYIIIHKIANNIAVAGIFTLLVLIHPLMQGVFIYAYSEPVFIALLCMLLLIFSYIDNDNLNKISIFSGLLIGMVFLRRYGAIAIIPAVILGVLTINLVPMRKKLIACSLVLISCSVIITPCLLRNYFVDGTLFGIRTESEDTILFALKRVALVTTEWFSPFRLKRYYKLGLGIIFIIVFGVISSFFLKNSSAKNPVIISCLAFVVTHSALMVYTPIHTVVDPIDSRYLSPAIAPAIFTLLGSSYIIFQKFNFHLN